MLVAPVYPEDPLSASLNGVYDFVTPIDVDRYERIDAARFDWFWYDGLAEFELVQELLRLDRARGDTARLPILRRIGHNPLRRDIDLAALVARYVEDPAAASRLIAECFADVDRSFAALVVAAGAGRPAWIGLQSTCEPKERTRR